MQGWQTDSCVRRDATVACVVVRAEGRKKRRSVAVCWDVMAGMEMSCDFPLQHSC